MDIKKLENESDLHFAIRCCEAKTTETWDEIGEYINLVTHNNYTSSRWRKMYQYYALVKDEFETGSFNDLDEIKNLKQELKSERIKIQTLNLERNRLDRENARQELFYEQIGQYIQSREVPKLEPKYSPRNKRMKYLLGIADIHANAYWRTATNEYSMQIVQDRLTLLLTEIISFIKEKQLDELNIILLGDLIDGCLRMSNLQTMDSTVSKSVADISDMLIGFLEVLIEKTHIHINLFDVVYGNHSMPRFLQNYDMREDLGYTINRYIRTGLRNNKNIDIYSPLDGDMYLDFNIWDFNVIGFHGHTEKNQSEAIKNFTIQRRKLYDYSVCGHLHSNQKTAISLDGLHDVENIQFPSFCGDDPYANSIHKISKGSCMICGFDKDFGFIESHKIILN